METELDGEIIRSGVPFGIGDWWSATLAVTSGERARTSYSEDGGSFERPAGTSAGFLVGCPSIE